MMQTLSTPPWLSALARALARLSTTRANSYAGLAADISVGVALVGAGLWRNEAGLGAALAALATGLLGFSFVEYAFHRWLFHGAPSAMQRGHHQHHVNPRGFDSLPFFVAPMLMLALAALLATILSTAIALLLAGALASGYAIYGLTHLLIHYRRFERPAVRRWAALHHIHHAHPERNFGVTTPLWDIVLRTRYVPKRQRLAP